MRRPFAGTGALVRLALRRDRIMMVATAIGLLVLVAGSVKATQDLYPDPNAPALQAAIAVLKSPSTKAMYGPISSTSLPALATIKSVFMGGVAVAILGAAIVRRHTRADEESGRFELIGSTETGRVAPAAAAVAAGAMGVLLCAGLSWVSLVALGLGVAGSSAFALGWIAVGFASVGVTAVAAQVTSSARGCSGLVATALGVSWVLRLIGDTTSGAGWLTWLSPFGWNEKAAGYGADRGWVGLIGLAFLAACLAVAAALLARRDLGAGMLPQRRGHDRAPASLASPLGLSWRTMRGGLLGWAIGFLLLGAIVGKLSTQVKDMASDSSIRDMLRKLGGNADTLTNVYFATEIRFAVMIAAAFGVATILRLHSEETVGHSESALAGAVGRARYLTAFVVPALVGTALLLIVIGLAMGAGAKTEVGALAVAPLAGLPAAWTMVGVAALVVAALPERCWLAWALYAAAFAVGEFGPILRLPDWLTKVSPFAHVPALPGGTVAWSPFVVLTVCALVLIVAAYARFRTRDIG